MSPNLLSIAAVAGVLATWIVYLARVKQSKTPAKPLGSIMVQIAGVGAGVAAIVWESQNGGSVAATVVALSGLAIVLGSLFLLLLTQARTPIGDIKVKVGDTLLPFTACTSDGAHFSTDEFAGKRVLLKFFRGGW